MAKARTAVIEKVDKFIHEAKKKIDIEKVILYGSNIKGRKKTWSDIDIAVISDDFAGMSLKERLTMLKKIAWDAEVTEIDPIGYTSEEFNKDDPFNLTFEIKEHGQIIYQK